MDLYPGLIVVEITKIRVPLYVCVAVGCEKRRLGSLPHDTLGLVYRRAPGDAENFIIYVGLAG
jgi:hypothetical protein